MKTAWIRFGNTLWLAFALAVVSPSGDCAAQGPLAQPAPIAGLTSPGASVTVTLWTGGRLRGVVVETTDCDVVLRTSSQSQAVPLWKIKTVRLHASTPGNPAARVATEIAGQCDEIGCLPIAFFYIGIGAVIQGVDDLAHPPKVVYRATQRLAAQGACAQLSPAR